MNKFQERMLDFIESFNTINFDKKYSLLYPDEESKYGLSVPRIIFTYSDVKIPPFKLKTFRYMFGSIHQIKKSFRDLKSNVANAKKVLTQDDYLKIKEYAISVGALDVGFTKIPKNLIFSNHAVLFENALVITAEMRKEIIDLAPNRETGHEVHRTYHALSVIVNKVARFMRKLGYNTQANSTLGGDVNFVALAKEAGMGEIGNHGLLISEKVGPRQRIAGVYLEASLDELESTRPDYSWIRDFCIKCQKCVRMCPGDAIDPMGLIENKTVMIDFKKCAVPFANSTGCSVCIKECVFNNVDLNEVKRKAA